MAGQEVLVTAGIGIALYPRHGNDISTLFKHADAAMLAAKLEKSGAHLFDGQLDAGGPGRFALIQTFTWWALETAMRQCIGWLKRRFDLRIEVNVPISVIMDTQFMPELTRLVDRHGVRGGITPEITENVFFGDYDRLNAILSQLRSFGIECSIDDFGTGHSSLSRLRQLPAAELEAFLAQSKWRWRG